MRWIAELIGYPADCGGLLVSGGNMANIVGFLAARRAQARLGRPRPRGCARRRGRARVYARPRRTPGSRRRPTCSGSAPTRSAGSRRTTTQRMDVDALRETRSTADRDGRRPAVPRRRHGRLGQHRRGRSAARDRRDLPRAQALWFHVDGAYGALRRARCPTRRRPAGARAGRLGRRRSAQVALRAARGRLRARARRRGAARRVQLPPALLPLRHGRRARSTTSSYGPQNSRGFRALKVWLALRQVGRERLRADDRRRLRARPRGSTSWRRRIRSSRPCTHEPEHHDVPLRAARPARRGGRRPPTISTRSTRSCSTACSAAARRSSRTRSFDGRFLLRACIVNFRTTAEDIEALPGIVARLGGAVDAELRPAELHAKAPRL